MDNINQNICYNCKFSMPYTEVANFKEKEAIYINKIVGGGHLRDIVKFSGYANITFDNDDIKHWNPKFNILDNFVRNKSNSLVYNLVGCSYDKMFVYKTNYKVEGFYGIILYNTSNDKCLNIFNIELNYSKLIITISRLVSNKNN